MLLSLSARRAWIEISTVIVILRKRNTSLSARRAWIEMQNTRMDVLTIFVALRKESVDRNVQRISPTKNTLLSLSARRAWIEIAFPGVITT